MADTSKFKTSHQLAKELLEGPDVIVVIPTPTFDMPGSFTAFPARAEKTKVQDVDAIAILPDLDALQTSEPQPPPTPPDATGS